MKPIIGTIGFMMLFFVPSEQAMAENLWKALGGWMLCFCVAITLLAVAGAFKKKPSTTNHRARAIARQLIAAITRSPYPTAYIPMQYWSWHWDRRGNVKYRHLRTLWQYLSASTNFQEPPHETA